MATLIIVEHNNQVMHPVTRHVVTAAKLLDKKCVLLVIGFNCHSVCDAAASIDGVETVMLADNPCYEHHLPENSAQLVADIAVNFDVVMSSSSTFGKNLLPRVAALMDVAQVSDITRVVDAHTFERPIYAGNAIETVRVLDSKIVLSIRETAFAADAGLQKACPVQSMDKIIPLQDSRWVQSLMSISERPELTQANIVVSGGRGLQSKDNFKLIEQLADALGAAVGASRAAVDAGFVPNDYQVGQTGKVVAPQLYIAVGISGAVQHLAGMKDSKIIIAINKDEDAPIMKIATYYLVGDLFELLPQLIDKLANLNKNQHE